MAALIQSIAIQILITVIAVAGIYVLTGLTGMFSLGSAAFMAIGSYASGLLVVRLGLPVPVAFVLAIALSVLIGFIVGLPTVRLRRDYISLVTLGFGEAIIALLNSATTLTGGANGFAGIPRVVTLPLAIVCAVVVVALVAWFKTSKYGRQCIAVKGDELAAKAMGVNVPRVKMIAFLVSVAITSFAGCLYAFYITFVDPSTFGWKQSAEWVIMVFFGGANSLTGSIFGALFLGALPEFLRSLLTGLEQYRTIIYAVLVLLIINFKPSGVFGEWEITQLSPKNLATRRARKASAKSAKGGAQ